MEIKKNPRGRKVKYGFFLNRPLIKARGALFFRKQDDDEHGNQ